MTLTNHVMTGAVLAVTIKNPLAGAALAYASHFVLDALPHFGFNHPKSVFERNRQLSFQLTLTFSILLTLVLLPIIIVWTKTTISFWHLALCILAAVGPDLVWVPRFFQELATGKVKPRGPVSELHARIQNDSLALGAAIESLWFVTMLVGLLIFTK